MDSSTKSKAILLDLTGGVILLAWLKTKYPNTQVVNKHVVGSSVTVMKTVFSTF